MLKDKLMQIIANGENSGVEFKRDGIRPEQLAKEIIALANFNGGMILLGVEDDGNITGIHRQNCEEWVMHVFKDKIHPMMLPYYEEILIDDKKIAVISFPQGISKPYVLRHAGSEEIYIRVGSTSQKATREQQARLFDLGGLLHTEMMPVPGTSPDTLDRERLKNYLMTIIADPEIPQTDAQWEERLMGLGFLVKTPMGQVVCTIAGLVLFGISPRRFLSQAGLRIMVFGGQDKTYRALMDEVLDGPIVGRFAFDSAGNKKIIDDGLIEKMSYLLRPFITQESDTIDEVMRKDKTWLYPWDAVRETIINALAHRDWTRSVDIEVAGFSDRLEVISPGSLHNSMTIDKMKAGQRSPRNPTIVSVLRDYGYVDARGMGVRTKVIPLMIQQNHMEPLFEATEDFLKTTLRQKLGL